ncbi:MAG TPA: hypothetical protein VEX86_27605 [Longimicrobium sp.]|nr:hypothetical protein [Longimicrobium sp.]
MASKKLNLDVDLLHVESFEAEAAENARGTVQGNMEMITVDYTCYDYTCRGYGTCNIYPCKNIP